MKHPLLCWDIIQEGMSRRQTFGADIAALHSLMKRNDWHLKVEQSLDNAIVWENKTILITDPDLQIVLATKNIYRMNGYRADELIGRHPRMFQGPATLETSKKEIKTAIEMRIPFNSNIINYRKDGSTYTCHIEAYPIHNTSGRLVNFIAFENIAHDY